ALSRRLALLFSLHTQTAVDDCRGAGADIATECTAPGSAILLSPQSTASHPRTRPLIFIKRYQRLLLTGQKFGGRWAPRSRDGHPQTRTHAYQLDDSPSFMSAV